MKSKKQQELVVLVHPIAPRISNLLLRSVDGPNSSGSVPNDIAADLMESVTACKILLSYSGRETNADSIGANEETARFDRRERGKSLDAGAVGYELISCSAADESVSSVMLQITEICS